MALGIPWIIPIDVHTDAFFTMIDEISCDTSKMSQTMEPDFSYARVCIENIRIHPRNTESPRD